MLHALLWVKLKACKGRGHFAREGDLPTRPTPSLYPQLLWDELGGAFKHPRGLPLWETAPSPILTGEGREGDGIVQERLPQVSLTPHPCGYSAGGGRFSSWNQSNYFVEEPGLFCNTE